MFNMPLKTLARLQRAASARLLLLALMVFSSQQVFAATPSDKNVTQLLELSGVAQQISEFPSAMKSGIAQAGQQGQIPKNLASDMQQQIDLSLNEQRMLSGIATAVQQRLTSDQVNQLLTWYRSETGQKITAAEAKASSPEAQQEMMQEAKRLMQQTDRVKQAQRINQAAGITDITLEMQKQVSIGIFAGLSRAMQPEKAPEMAAFKSQLQQVEPQLRQQLDQIVTVALVYTYRNLGAEPLQAYENFLIQPAAKAFNRTVTESISQSIEQVVLQWAADMTVAAR